MDLKNEFEHWTPDAAAGLAGLRARKQAAQDARARTAGFAAAVILAGGGLLSYPVTRAYAERCVAACVGAMTGRQPVPEHPEAPDFAYTDAFGHKASLSDLRGRVVLLNFWATWCNPCREETPWFVEFQREYGSRGLVVLGVSMDEEGWDAVRPFAAAQKLNYAVTIGGSEISKLYEVTSLPTTVLIDRSGRIVEGYAGMAEKEEYRTSIEQLLGSGR